MKLAMTIPAFTEVLQFHCSRLAAGDAYLSFITDICLVRFQISHMLFAELLTDTAHHHADVITQRHDDPQNPDPAVSSSVPVDKVCLYDGLYGT